MIFYVSYLCFVCAVMYVLRKRENLMFAACFLCLLFLIALKGEGMGADYEAYERYFQLYRNLGLREIFQDTDIEKGFVMLIAVVGRLGGEYQGLIVLCGVLSLGGVVFFMKKYAYDPVLSVWLFITFGGYEHLFTRMRQSIALSVILIAYHFAAEKKFWKYLLLVLLAAFFHKTAWIALPLYPVFQWKLSREKAVGVGGLLLLVLICKGPFMELIFRVMPEYAQKYRNMNFGSDGRTLLLLYLVMGIFVFLFVLHRKKQMEIKSMRLLVHTAWLTVLMQMLALEFPLWGRMVEYFSLPFLILFGNTIKECIKPDEKRFVRMVTYGVPLLMYLYLIQTSQWMVPFRFVWG